MDNLTHTLVGSALAKTRLGKAAPLAGAALVVGANLPDIDFIVRFWNGQAGYLCDHRGITHALVGVVGTAFLLGGFLFLLSRWRYPENPGTYKGIFLASLIGLATHPLLDYLNTYGVRPWLPFDGTWYYGDLVFIVEPVFWILFGGVTALAGERSRWGTVLLILIGAAATWIIYFSGRGTALLEWTWPIGVLAIVAARWLGWGRNQSRLIHIIGWVGFAVFLLVSMWLRGQAADATDYFFSKAVKEGESVQVRTLHPTADLRRWRVVAETQERLFWVYATVGEEPPTKGKVVPLNREEPRLEEVKDTYEYYVWKVFARHPIVAVEGKTIWMLDGRYQYLPFAAWSALSAELP